MNISPPVQNIFKIHLQSHNPPNVNNPPNFNNPPNNEHCVFTSTTNTPNIETSLFINKYKPLTINEFYSNEKLKIVLKTLLQINDLNILLVGNSCCGKTTLLNAIVREYYEIPKNGIVPENNILYINNLKEQGIVFFRNEMKTFSQTKSNIYGKKKLIIIDDIDAINEQSQQVFRNYIDKYKNNIFFLSVCTNLQKVIDSIQSRIHILRIDPPSSLQIQNLMNTIIKNENINLSQDAKEFILKYSKNSIRIMINYLEKIYILSDFLKKRQSEQQTLENDYVKILNIDYTKTTINETPYNEITMNMCMLLCTDIKIHTFETYFLQLQNHKLKEAINTIYEIYDYGFSVIDILEMIFIFIKTTDILDEKIKYEIIKIICKYITVFYSVHEDIIELALFTNNLYSLWII
jgi:DNA polymerase III delta prime subunit